LTKLLKILECEKEPKYQDTALSFKIQNSEANVRRKMIVQARKSTEYEEESQIEAQDHHHPSVEEPDTIMSHLAQNGY
jgi:hypothetical protein